MSLKLPNPNRPIWMYHHKWEPFHPEQHHTLSWWVMLRFCLIYPFIQHKYKEGKRR